MPFSMIMIYRQTRGKEKKNKLRSRKEKKEAFQKKWARELFMDRKA